MMLSRPISMLTGGRHPSPYVQAFKCTQYGDTVLDLGGGAGGYYSLEQVEQMRNSKNLSVTIVDQLAIVETRPNMTRIQGDLLDALSRFEDETFDWVVSFDVIEHLPKHEGYKLIYEMERVCRKGAFIYTPNGFVRQAPSVNNPFNLHVSGWTPSELKKMGWNKQTGHVGIKWMHGEYSLPRYHGRWADGALYSAVKLLLTRAPALSFSFLAMTPKPLQGPKNQSTSSDASSPLTGDT